MEKLTPLHISKILGVGTSVVTNILGKISSEIFILSVWKVKINV